MNAPPEVRNIFDPVKSPRIEPAVGVRIVEVTGNDPGGLYVAELGPHSRVSAHYNHDGSEIYPIINGEGILYTGIPSFGNGVTWNSVTVKSGDCFTVQEREVHQLENSGLLPLMATIVRPEAHPGQDRFIVTGHIL